jgi:GntR family transcriptional regulator
MNKMPRQNTSQRLHETLGLIIAAAKPGDQLKSEPELARQLGVARATLREAMRTFEAQGLIYRKQGSGTFVTRPTQIIDTGLEVLESIETLARRIGLPVAMGELRISQHPANNDEAIGLGILPGATVLHLSRVILAEGHPVAYLIDILPDDVLSSNDLVSGFTGSVLDLLIKRGTPVLVSSRTEITAVNASPEVARSLGIQRGDVLLHFTAYLYAETSRVIDYSFSYFLPGYFRFHVVRRIHQ